MSDIADAFFSAAVRKLDQDVSSPLGLVRVVRLPICKILPSRVGQDLSWAIRPDDLAGYEAAIREGYKTDFTIRVPDKLNHCVMAIMVKP